MTSISRRRGRFDTALGGQDQFAELAGCAFTAARLCHPVGVLANETGSIGHSHAQADTPDDRQVWQIVTQISDLFVAQVQLAQQLVQNYQLVFATLIQVLYAEVFCPSLHHRCLASTDDSGDHARCDQHLDALAVEGVESLEFAAVFQEVQAAIGQDAVYIEDSQLDVLAALQQVSRHFYITPARKRSPRLNAPTGWSCSSTTIRAPILWSSMIFKASAASISARAVLPWTVITSSMVATRISMARSRVRRRSPSVKIPARRPSASTMAVMPKPLRVISISESRSSVPRMTLGRSSPVCMTCSTFSSKRRPSAPPGCENAKSSAVKPRASSSATANASPMTRAAVVEEVGARFRGQASCRTCALRLMSAALASGESGLPVRLIILMPSRLISGSRVMISAVEPELDRARMMSSRVIMPMSPWLASAGCTKNEVVPVLASVAAIFLPMCPDLPMPTTTTRPLLARIISQALTKSASIWSSKPSTASISRRMVRCAD